jgi:hypothetical protein
MTQISQSLYFHLRFQFFLLHLYKGDAGLREVFTKMRRVRKQTTPDVTRVQRTLGQGTGLVECSACNGFSCNVEPTLAHPWFAPANLGPFDGSQRRRSGERKHVPASSCTDHECKFASHDTAACIGKDKGSGRHGPAQSNRDRPLHALAQPLRFISHLHIGAIFSAAHHWFPSASKALQCTGARERCMSKCQKQSRHSHGPWSVTVRFRLQLHQGQSQDLSNGYACLQIRNLMTSSKAPADCQSPEWVNCSSRLGNCQSATAVAWANEVRAATLALPRSITTWLFLPFANGSPSEHGQFFVLLFVTAALPDMIHNTRTATRHQNKYLRDLCVSTSACCVHLAVALRAKLTSLPSIAVLATAEPQIP